MKGVHVERKKEMVLYFPSLYGDTDPDGAVLLKPGQSITLTGTESGTVWEIIVKKGVLRLHPGDPS